jgi:hypothetical protein
MRLNIFIFSLERPVLHMLQHLARIFLGGQETGHNPPPYYGHCITILALLLIFLLCCSSTIKYKCAGLYFLLV